MSLVFSVPGKTFLAGEYLALGGGPTLVFASTPKFEMRADIGAGGTSGIHADSPAGKFLRLHQDYFSQFDLTFSDPYQGRGGFGASTAQFLSVYAMYAWKESAHHEPQKLLDYKHLLECYYQVAWDGQGQRPSGADLVGQLKGGLSMFEKQVGKISSLSWGFQDLDFTLIHTGNKVATHEHLKKLTAFNSESLALAFDKILSGLQLCNENFVAGIKDYAKALATLNFTCESTLLLLRELENVPGVLAAKGCGALGADVVLVVFEREKEVSLNNYLQQKNLTQTVKRSQMGDGLDVRAVRSAL